MIETMLALGPYRFSVGTAAYQNLKHSAAYRWPMQERLGRLPARQFVGAGDETISLDGSIYPHYKGGLGQLDSLRAIAGQGLPLRLTDGRGIAWGQWCVTQIDETQTVFFADGTPRKVDFSLTLARYGEDA